MTVALFLVAVFWLAWSNGANDNFKGVATLWGSKSASYKTALVWATVASLLGSATSLWLASGLTKVFSGAGLVGDELARTPALLLAVACAAAMTVMLATLLGMPTSTTHALTGALVGAGLMAVGPANVSWQTLGTKFAQPLLISPVIAIFGSAMLYPLLHRLRLRSGVNRQTCLCIGREAPRPVQITADGHAMLKSADATLSVRVGRASDCADRYEGQVVGVGAQGVVDSVHFASAAAVCFARAVNDTPKIAALLMAASAIETRVGLLWVTMAMAVGGIVQSHKVARTMSQRITDLNPGQGLTANLVTAALVLGASRFGLPVSTTHVTCGSIFGIGMVRGKPSWKTIAQILVTWVSTLPMGLCLGAAAYAVFHYWGL